MTEREAIERIEDHMEVHKIGQYPHIRLAEALQMAIAALRARQEPTAPLTIEELREMDGEPVWIKQLQEDSLFCGGWALVTGFGAINKKHSQLFRDYGEIWLAYRRKPEGV